MKTDEEFEKELIRQFYNHDCLWTEDPRGAICEMGLNLDESGKKQANVAWRKFCVKNKLIYTHVFPEVEPGEPYYKQASSNKLRQAVKESESDWYSYSDIEQFGREYDSESEDKEDEESIVRAFMDFAEKIGKPCRRCSVCGKLMREGYFYNHGTSYYCSDECLHTEFTDEEWRKECEENDQSYYTEL